MASATPRLLVVANANESADVLAALAEVGIDRPELGTGGDETLELFESSEPDVVVMVAGLVEGDLSSLAGAMRSGSYGRPAPIVLIAGTDDSSRAEDVKAIEFDHFIERPIQAKKLLDAVMASTRSATGARLEAAMALAIEDFVSDAMGSLSFSPQPSAPNPTSVAAQAATQDESQAESQAAEQAAEQAEALPSEDTNANTRVQADSAASPAAQATQAPTQVVPESPALPPLPTSNWREETKVLGEGTDPSDPGMDQESQELLDELLPGDTDSGEEEDSEQPPQPVSPALGASGPPPGAQPKGGDFARQLREKMSAMAERLFPGQQSDEHAISMAAPSAEHTEIDLGSIVDEEGADRVEASTEAMVSESEITMARGSDTGAKTGQHQLGEGIAHAGQSLVGQLDAHESDIATVLASFWSSDFSGSLVLRRDQEEKRVQFDKGSVVFASSAQQDDRMSELLLREGRINATQLEECHFQVEATGRRMGEVLVDKGYLKPRELLPAVRRHLEDIFYSLFAWESGSFNALPGQSLDERIPLSRHPAALIVEGIRRKYDMERVEGCLGPTDTVVMVDGSQRLNNIVGATELSVGELQVQRLFDGSQSLETIAAECEVEVLRVAQLAHAFVCLGVAEIVETRSEESSERGSASGSHFVGEIDLEIDRQRVLAKYQLVQCANYFQLLGVRLDASAFEIRRAYESSQRNFAMESFPASLQEELRDMIGEIGELIEEAFLVLGNDSVRSSYRANLQ